MNNTLFKAFLCLSIALLFTGCGKVNEKEINIGLNEVIVYFDNDSEKFKVLSNGKHKIVTDYDYSKFSLEDLKIQDRLSTVTNDEKEVTVDLTYWYSFKKKGIIKIHKNYGDLIEETLILPNIRSVVRKEFINMSSDSLNHEKLRLALLRSINSLNDYSELIDSKSFIITELNIEK